MHIHCGHKWGLQAKHSSLIIAVPKPAEKNSFSQMLFKGQPVEKQMCSVYVLTPWRTQWSDFGKGFPGPQCSSSAPWNIQGSSAYWVGVHMHKLWEDWQSFPPNFSERALQVSALLTPSLTWSGMSLRFGSSVLSRVNWIMQLRKLEVFETPYFLSLTSKPANLRFC